MKIKLLCLLFFALSSASFAQIKKKTSTTKKTTSAVKKTIKNAQPKLIPAGNEGIFAEIETSKGMIVIQLEFQKTPITVANFIALAEGTNAFVKPEYKGKLYYDGLKFHRVIKDFMIQGGDPLGTGSGDPGYKFKDEFTDLKHNTGGILSMANSGPGTNGSQFFITHKETSWLDGKHTVFGKVTKGMDVVNAIAQDDIIKKVTIKRNGALAKAFDATRIFSSYFATKADGDKNQGKLDAESNKAAEENRKKQALLDAETKKNYVAQYGTVMASKLASLQKSKTTATKSDSGLEYVVVKGKGAKPVDGTTIYVHYAGYLEDGSLFDSSYEEVNKTFGKFDQNRAAQNGYQPFPFAVGAKTGLIPGFLEGLNMLSFGDKATLFIPSKLGYGESGAGGVIPPNANIIFEMEILETLPTKK